MNDPYPCYDKIEACSYNGLHDDHHCTGCVVPEKKPQKPHKMKYNYYFVQELKNPYKWIWNKDELRDLFGKYYLFDLWWTKFDQLQIKLLYINEVFDILER